MGWYTELKIGKKTWSWRKDLPSIVPIMFYGTNSVKGLELVNTKDNYNEYFIGYDITAKKAIQNLDNLGITLEFLISIYSKYRPHFMRLGVAIFQGGLEVMKVMQESGKIDKTDNYSKWIERINRSDAKMDIMAAIEILKSDREIETSRTSDFETPFLPSILVVKKNEDFNDSDLIEACTFGIFLEYALEHLPEIYQLYEWRLWLEACNNKVKVTLNLAEWLYEGGDIEEVIPSSIKELSDKVITYSKTFDTLIGGNETLKIEYSRRKLIEDWKHCQNSNLSSYEKGLNLEIFTATLVDSIKGLSIIEKNLRSEFEELDLIVKNNINNPFIQTLNSPILLIECKNWSTPVGVDEARVFESKIRELGKRANIGMFVAINGVTSAFKKHLNNIKREDYTIVVITYTDINELIYSSDLNSLDWLETMISKHIIQDGW